VSHLRPPNCGQYHRRPLGKIGHQVYKQLVFYQPVIDLSVCLPTKRSSSRHSLLIPCHSYQTAFFTHSNRTNLPGFRIDLQEIISLSILSNVLSRVSIFVPCLIEFMQSKFLQVVFISTASVRLSLLPHHAFFFPLLEQMLCSVSEIYFLALRS
jgi:hypothetical protein